MPGTTETSSGVPSVSSQSLRKFDLGVEREVDEVAGHREVIDADGLDVGDDVPEHAVMQDMAAVALPVDVADHALGREVAIGYIGQADQDGRRRYGRA